MKFKVANVISAFNSKSGGPPRTVTLIATAGLGHWQADLFTTGYLESDTDSLLIKEFPGHANVSSAMSHSTLGGIAMLTGVSRGFRTQLLMGVVPDVVHIHGMWSPYLAAFALTAKRSRIPYIVAPHGMLEPWSLTFHSVRKSLALRTYQGDLLAHAAAIHTTSDMEARNIARLRVSEAPIFVVPNAVEEPPDRIDDNAPADDQQKVLLFLSRLHPKKGLDMLLDVWNQLRPPQWRLLIVGSGEERYVASLREYCASNAIPDVEFKAHAEGNARETIFRRASAFVLPTYSENFGNVVAEALIRGLPVITTTGTPWSAIAEEQCGWYIEPTADELKRAIAEATGSDPEKLRAMGAKGRDFARAKFTVPAVRSALLTMYHSVIQ